MSGSVEERNSESRVCVQRIRNETNTLGAAQESMRGDQKGGIRASVGGVGVRKFN